MFQRMTDVAWRACPAALALALLVLFAGPPAAAETDRSSRTAKRQELEQGVLDVTHMFQNDPRYNRGKTPDQIKDGVEFVTGNVLFVLAHETAHALISVFEIPVIGREEDAADALAAIVALKMGNSFADRVVVNAARGWFLSDRPQAPDPGVRGRLAVGRLRLENADLARNAGMRECGRPMAFAQQENRRLLRADPRICPAPSQLWASGIGAGNDEGVEDRKD